MKGKVSKTGYKRNSPDRNNDYNIIPSGRITMRDVQFPVYGVDEYGNAQMMHPGGEYQFPGNTVFELPMAQVGRQMSGSVGYDSMYNSPVAAFRYMMNPQDDFKYYGEVFGTKQGPGIAAGLDYDNKKYGTQGMIRLGLDPLRGASIRAEGGKRFNPIDKRREELSWGPYGGVNFQTNDYMTGVNTELPINNLRPRLTAGVNAQYNRELANRGRFSIEGDFGVGIGDKFADMGQFKPEPYGAVRATYSPPMYRNTRNKRPSSTTYDSGYRQLGGEPLMMAQLGGMRRGKVDRILNENKDLNWVQRLYEPNTPSIQIPGQSGPSTHFMESADGKVYPTVVQMPDGQLQYLGDDAYEYAMQTGEYIQFKNDRQAQRFAKSYKKGTDVLKEYGKGGLTQWFAEKWVDVKTGEECGRSGKDKDGRPYPACRPSRRVNETTPKTASEMSAAEKARFKREKTSGKRIDYNHERAQDGKEVKPQRTSWGDYMNPMNWGVYTYDDAGSFKQAFAQARQDGQDEFMWYGKRYTTELATPAKPKPTAAPQQPNMDFEALKRGVAYVESKNGKFMWNPESSATGLYGQRFTEIKGTPVYGGTREQFKTDVAAQNKVFELRYSGQLPGYNTGLKQDALDLYKEYYPIVKKNNIQPIELAALSNFLGRQGARYYLGYVLRDGKSLAQALPDIYGGSAGQKNKTPEQYLAEFRKAAYGPKQEEGGEIENYPDYSDYNDYSMAWLAARRELGKNKMFKYGGMVSSTCTPTGL